MCGFDCDDDEPCKNDCQCQKCTGDSGCSGCSECLTGGFSSDPGLFGDPDPIIKEYGSSRSGVIDSVLAVIDDVHNKVVQEEVSDAQRVKLELLNYLHSRISLM